ncbi:hypothetical protein SLEP1_g18057 [Rubroshorea leprosula]|uniref:Retrovirus-related Pol polyprotein from transposon TNT 1-94-like beta-barrel domain-containing protein n=1 Tax=Rubroshorea leprosula TaxID=152421 RepID=A0AAV5IZV1_9ROSI|nr:hypothetical protein SLEP1_g18057 [Rubroshorea leprosula]
MRHSEEVAKRYKALTCLHSAVIDEIFNRIMTCETAKEAWDKLKVEFQGDNKVREMEVLNLKREFALIRMKDTETVKEFSDRLMKVVNKIRLQGEELSDKAVVEKVLVSLLEKFEHKISSLEDSKDLSQFSLNELVNALQAVEQRKALRLENNVEGAYLATERDKVVAEDDENKQLGDQRNQEKEGYQNNKKESYASCSHYLVQQAKIAEIVEEEEHLFMATKTGDCSAAILSSDSWLIDSGCTNHMTPNAAIFKSLDRKYNSKVRLGNGELMEVKGKGVAAVETQTVEDEFGSKMFTVRINERSFPIQWKQIEISPKASVVDVSKSEEFDESATWNWESSKFVAADQVLVANDEPIFDFGNDEFEQENDDEFDDVFAIRGTRTQVDIYERCNMVIEELANYLEATRLKAGRITMQEEFAMKSCKAVNDSLVLGEKFKNEVQLVYCNSEGQIVDILYKGFAKIQVQAIKRTSWNVQP